MSKHFCVSKAQCSTVGHCLLLSPPLGGSLLGCPCIYKEFLLGWMGFGREAKRHFLTDFSAESGLFWGILYLRRIYESRESVVY